MFKKFLLTVYITITTGLCADTPNTLIPLCESIQKSKDIPTEAKIGLDHITYWRNLHQRHPNKDDQIPELKDQMLLAVTGAKAQLQKFYTPIVRNPLIDRIDNHHTNTLMILDGNNPTIIQWYGFLVDLISISYPSIEKPYSEVMTYANLLLDMGYIIAPVFPTQETPLFDGHVGYAAAVAGLTHRVWLAGVSFRPDLVQGDYHRPEITKTIVSKTDQKMATTPNLFLWYQVVGDAFIFIIKYKSFFLESQLSKIARSLTRYPAAENFQFYFEAFRKNNSDLIK